VDVRRRPPAQASGDEVTDGDSGSPGGRCERGPRRPRRAGAQTEDRRSVVQQPTTVPGGGPLSTPGGREWLGGRGADRSRRLRTGSVLADRGCIRPGRSARTRRAGVAVSTRPDRSGHRTGALTSPVTATHRGGGPARSSGRDGPRAAVRGDVAGCPTASVGPDVADTGRPASCRTRPPVRRPGSRPQRVRGGRTTSAAPTVAQDTAAPRTGRRRTPLRPGHPGKQ
jgi:hypothetical protein